MGVERLFKDNVCRVVGGGSDTYFWTDNWMGGVPLRIRFPCLFKLAENTGQRLRTWRGAGGRLGVMRGAGVRAFMLGRRRALKNVLFYCMMLFCRLLFMIDGGGLLIPLTVIQ